MSLARQKSFTATNIRSGFWNTGHIPVNKDIILRNIPTPNSAPHTPQPIEDLPSPGHLDHLTVEEMTQFSTPTSIRQLHYEEHLLQEAKGKSHSNSPHSWKRRRIFTNITHAAHHSMLEAEEHKQEITTILAAERKERERRKNNRQRIPAEGRTWLDKTDVDIFFANQEVEKKRKKKATEEWTQKVIERHHLLLKEIERKKIQAVKYEQEGSLPQTWKTAQQHELEQKKVEEKLARLLADRVNSSQQGEEDAVVGSQPAHNREMGSEGKAEGEETGGNISSDGSDAATPCPVNF